MLSIVQRGLLAVILMAAHLPGVWAEVPRITWAMVEWPPYTILKYGKIPATSSELGQGAVDRMMFEMINRLPGYDHRFERSNVQRVWGAMEHGENYCYPAAIQTPERLKYAYFTPALLGSPMAMVVHPSIRDALVGGASTVSLSKVIEQHGAEGRLQFSRSYGSQLDDVLEKSTVALPRDKVPSTGAMLKPLSAGRFGFTLEYPAVVEYARRQGQLMSPLVTVAIDEAPDWIVGYVACTRNAWGKRAIEDIDLAIRKASAVPNYRDAMGDWMPAAYAKSYRPKMRLFYSQRAAGPAQVQ